MGWNLNKQSKGWLVGAASTLLMTGLFASQAGAQLPIDIVTLQNQNLALTLGRSLLYSGSIQVDTTASNPTDPGNNLLDGSPIEAPNAVLVPTFGSHLYVRVDGGRGHGGYDYIFGRVTNLNPSLSGFGQWLFSPTVIGSHLVAKWQAVRTSLDGNTSFPTGLGNILTPNYDPKIEIDLFATIIHDQVRFEFKVTNNSDARQHDVALAFTQDASIFLARSNGLRTPGSSYFRTETLFSGASIPQTWEAIALNSKKDGTFGSQRGILKPSNTGQSEPTPPTRFALGWVDTLNGAELNVFNTSYAGRNFDLIWNFNDNKKRRVIGKNTTFLPGSHHLLGRTGSRSRTKQDLRHLCRSSNFRNRHRQTDDPRCLSAEGSGLQHNERCQRQPHRVRRVSFKLFLSRCFRAKSDGCGRSGRSAHRSCFPVFRPSKRFDTGNGRD